MTAPDQVLARLTRLHPKLIDLSLGRMERLLARLGNPERRLPPVVHIAGTNGKGSVVAFLRAMLTEAGRTCHVYISPHLVRFNERIVVAGEEIADAALIALLEECERANAGAPITFFEITTAAALLAFSRTPADVTLLEVGLGGRLDATNVIAHPAATAITPVSIDHVQYLGGTLGEIALEKAGILKPGTPAVIASQPAAVMRAIEARAAAVGAPLFRAGCEWRAEMQDGRLRFSGPNMTFGDLPPPGLPGRHQIGNAGVALACLGRLGDLRPDEAAIRRGLAGVRWPARLQRLRRGPLLAALPPDWELWLDGGHNPAAGEALARHAETWRDRPLHLVVGMLETKDAAGFLRPLAPLAESTRCVGIPGAEAALTADALAAAAAAAGIATTAASSVAAAVANCLERGAGPARILICGSLYLAGEVLREHG